MALTGSRTSFPSTEQARASRAGNVAALTGERPALQTYALAAAAGLLLAAAFPPLKLWPLAFVALVPLPLLSRRPGRSPFLVGYCFGFTFWLAGLAFLREVSWLAPIALAPHHGPLPRRVGQCGLLDPILPGTKTRRGSGLTAPGSCHLPGRIDRWAPRLVRSVRRGLLALTGVGTQLDCDGLSLESARRGAVGTAPPDSILQLPRGTRTELRDLRGKSRAISAAAAYARRLLLHASILRRNRRGDCDLRKRFYSYRDRHRRPPIPT